MCLSVPNSRIGQLEVGAIMLEKSHICVMISRLRMLIHRVLLLPA